MRETTNRRTRLVTLLVVTLAAALTLSSCAGTLDWIQDRLPPPSEVEEGIMFRFHAPSARLVTLAGDFNNWGGTQGGGRYDPSINPMSDPDGDGTWTLVVPLPPGRYQYKFVLDGGVRWEQDPSNPDKAMEGGFENSLVVVPQTVSYKYEHITGTVISESIKSGLVKRPDDTPTASEPTVTAEGVTFEVDLPDAGAVYLAGTFNDWDPEAQPLTKDDDGLWRVSVELEPGEYFYKFVVDGTWVEDPGNPESVDDGYGGVNSILTVE
ncbi:MAG: glycogen-binding domain-containing protein [Candidatus Eisenbacteria bacterium]|nr:glycogen-binding domain-containing protein [Candidatus Eisenbacteria bacterium]